MTRFHCLFIQCGEAIEGRLRVGSHRLSRSRASYGVQRSDPISGLFAFVMAGREHHPSFPGRLQSSIPESLILRNFCLVLQWREPFFLPHERMQTKHTANHITLQNTNHEDRQKNSGGRALPLVGA